MTITIQQNHSYLDHAKSFTVSQKGTKDHRGRQLPSVYPAINLPAQIMDICVDTSERGLGRNIIIDYLPINLQCCVTFERIGNRVDIYCHLDSWPAQDSRDVALKIINEIAAKLACFNKYILINIDFKWFGYKGPGTDVPTLNWLTNRSLVTSIPGLGGILEKYGIRYEPGFSWKRCSYPSAAFMGKLAGIYNSRGIILLNWRDIPAETKIHCLKRAEEVRSNGDYWAMPPDGIENTIRGWLHPIVGKKSIGLLGLERYNEVFLQLQERAFIQILDGSTRQKWT